VVLGPDVVAVPLRHVLVHGRHVGVEPDVPSVRADQHRIDSALALKGCQGRDEREAGGDDGVDDVATAGVGTRGPVEVAADVAVTGAGSQFAILHPVAEAVGEAV
jgi:hypothetical protein